MFTFTFIIRLIYVRRDVTGKAGGWDQVLPEHVKYGGPVLYELLTILFNAITKTEHVPAHFKKGTVIPIPKGVDKDLSQHDNYRGITLLPVLGKLYEKLLLQQSEPLFDAAIDDLQGAAHRGCSSLHTSFLLRETIAHNLEQDSAMYVWLLDTRKAFDTVWINGLLFKLLDAGITGKLWRILHNHYDGFQCCILTNGKPSEHFPVQQGVHQGAPFSMKLYELFINGLIRGLKELGLGAHIYEINCACPAFADDIAIIALFKAVLQLLVDHSLAYSRKWRFIFHALKCILLAFGRKQGLASDITLGNVVIPETDCATHVGVPVPVATGKDIPAIDDRISAARRALYTVLGLGNIRAPLDPLTASKLYWSLSVPKEPSGSLVCLSFCTVWKCWRPRLHVWTNWKLRTLATPRPFRDCLGKPVTLYLLQHSGGAVYKDT